MSEPSEEADRIRNKRLAKLSARASNSGQTSVSDQPTLSASSPESPPSISAPRESEQEAQAPASRRLSPTGLDRSKPEVSSQQAPSSIKINGITQRLFVRPAASSPDRSRSPRSHRSGQPVDPSYWEDSTISALFRITLSADHTQDSRGNRLFYTASVASGLLSDGLPLRWTIPLLDDAIIEAGTALGPLNYLLPCWKRVCRTQRGLSGRAEPFMTDVLKEARRLCLSYVIFAAEMPDMFGVENSQGSPLAPFLIREPDGDDGLCHDFLTDLDARMAEDEMAETALISALEQLSINLARLSFANPEYQTYMNVLLRFVHYKRIAIAITKSRYFLPNPRHPASQAEVLSLFGPFFRLSPMQREVQDSYYDAATRNDPQRSINAVKSLQLPGRIHQGQLFEVANSIIRASPEAREKMLDWFAAYIRLNLRRKGMQADERKFSSDGFMLNLTSVLDRLCEPFMDSSFSKIDRADIAYFRRNSRLDVDEETKLNADQKEAKQYHSQTAAGSNNFITEIFFLAAAIHHYGAGVAQDKMTDSDKNLKYLKKNLAQVKAEEQRLSQDPNANPLERTQTIVHVKKIEERIEFVEKQKLALQSALSEEQFAAQSIQFVRFLAVWLLRVVDPQHRYPSHTLQLPLPDDQSEDFKCLPEFLLTDVIDTYQFTFRFMPQTLVRTQVEQLVIFCITFLRSSESIRNPGLKAGLITILFGGVHPAPGLSNGILGDILTGLPFANEHLLHALIKAYIEAERTGTHNQFYDKFNIRYEIFQIFKCIWKSPIYHKKLLQEAEGNNQFFVQFVNMLVNDVTFVLDEAITALKVVHELQIDLRSSALTEEEKQQKEEQLGQEEGKATSYMQLTNETFGMFNLFTQSIPSSFVAPEIVQRLADMLDHNLDTLVSPSKFQNLRVEDPTKYGYQPKALLGDLFKIYFNLAHLRPFVLSIARDGRSYKPKTFQDALDLMKRKLGSTPAEQARWSKLATEVAAAKAEEELDDADMDDAPEEFIDPLMATIMLDPVILPSSKNNIDMSTIKSHLLSDPTDPFNRVPLKLENVIPNVELRQRIEAYRAEKRAARGREAAEAVEEAMDIDQPA